MGRKALVTGGSRGIGRACALALAAQGLDVAIGYRERDDAARAVAEDARTHGVHVALVPGDVRDDPEGVVTRAADALGGLDVFVASAVDPVARGVLELDAEAWTQSLETNARAVVLGAQAAAAHMQDGFGRIVAISATGGHRIRNPNYAPLGIAKGAVEAAVRFLAVALGPRGITVNAVAPGPTETDAFAEMARGRTPELKAELARQTPMGRLGTPDDAARLVAWLCSEDAGWVTGQTIFSDGGYSLV